MSKKTYCDICETEIPEPNGARIAASTSLRQATSMPTMLYVNVQLATNREYTQCDLDLCRDCLWRAIDQIDPREPGSKAEEAIPHA
jgi:hypothetical protein